MKSKGGEPMNKQAALKKKAEWLVYCLETGWEKSQLDELSELWDKHKDEYGNLKRASLSAPAGKEPSVRFGVELIAEERRRQVEVEKWDYSHDEDYKNGELIGAAACYTVNALNKEDIKARVQIYLPAETNLMAGNTSDRGDRQLRKAGWVDAWPWSAEWDKRKKHDKQRSLVIAGALIAAELDRTNGTYPAPSSNLADALEEIERLKKELDAAAFDIDLFEKEIERLKGLIEKAFNQSYNHPGNNPHKDFQQFKIENNL